MDRLMRAEMSGKYGSEPRVWDFYNTVLLRPEELILACKTVAEQ